MAPTFFRVMLAFVGLFAVLRGNHDERNVAIILVIGVVATHFAISPIEKRFSGLETNVLIIDLMVFAGFLWVALQSERFWPMWTAGLQLTTIFGHLLKSIESDLLARAYGAAMMFWGFPIMLILAVGTWRGHRRRVEADRQPTADT